ncbi:hypothetical protein N0V93_004296 [Gnomoniopsis smithogilvyi]|uniref:SH3 domain-containing protein n=1 Tax=Gnomoniopsis smithogilvyi TaxID=1191159 RepID=A0A9W8YSK9_9PEZI|nr:hypothetical protein N0V93_004296 [Gnomoniopsis smithogilvyi]
MAHRRGHFHALQRDAADIVAPAVKEKRVVTIYTTITSSGWTGGDLTTLSPSSTSTGNTKETKTTSSEAGLESAKGINKGIDGQTDSTLSSSSDLPTAIEATAFTATDMSGGLVAATSTPSTSSTSASSTLASSTTTAATAASESSASSTSTSSSSSSSSSGGSDVAVKAGIALGVLAGVFVILALVYFVIMRKKKQVEAEQRADDEKLYGNGSFDARPTTSSTPAKAPRLSLRPVTGLFTGFHTAGQGEQATRGVNSAQRRAPGTSAWERPSEGSNTSDLNPFGNHAQVLEEPGTPNYAMDPMTPISEASTHMASPEHVISPGLAPAPRVSPLPANPGSTAREVSAITMNSATIPPLLTTKDLPKSPPRSVDVSPIESMDGPSASSTNLAVIERQMSERRQSVRNDKVPAPLDLTLPPKMPSAVPPSPSGTEFSFSEIDPNQSPLPPSQGAAAIAEAGGPANTAVHRVQLDFVPTLDDELALKAGDVVRLLHEYDDGWCLCIKLDRSMQGVAPRSCLSSRPVKPRVRPQGRPRGPGAGQRGPGPHMSAFGPGNGSGTRPQSPGGPAYRPTQPSQQYGPGKPGPGPSHLPGQAY